MGDDKIRRRLSRRCSRPPYRTGNLIGGVAGFLLISNLPKKLGWQIIFSGYALSAAVGAWLGWKKVPETRRTQISQADGERTIPRELAKLMAIVFITSASIGMTTPIFIIFLQDMFSWGIRK
jgi:hypothetical protein